MRILVEGYADNYKFNPKFIEALGNQDNSLEEVTKELTNEVLEDPERFPNIYAAATYGSSTIRDEVEDAVLDRLFDIQDAVLSEDLDNYDIIDIIAEFFWEDISYLDNVDSDNLWYGEKLSDEQEAERRYDHWGEPYHGD